MRMRAQACAAQQICMLDFRIGLAADKNRCPCHFRFAFDSGLLIADIAARQVRARSGQSALPGACAKERSSNAPLNDGVNPRGQHMQIFM